jgi:helicase
MHIEELRDHLPDTIYTKLDKLGFEELRPAQYKAIEQGLFEDENLVVATPTASGKTLVAELAFLNAVYHDHGKAVYVVPLRALASEKYKDFTKDHPELDIAVSSGDLDSDDSYLRKKDVIVTTSEKCDSLIRHRAPWIDDVKVLIVDEIHLLNDVSRGPTLEVVITLLRQLVEDLQIIGLSATIGNPDELATWLDANLVEDQWRPVELKKGIYNDGDVTFYDE